MSGSIVGAPRSCAWRSLSSCCLNQNVTQQLNFINQMSWHLRGGFSHLVFPGQIKIWSVDFWGRLRTAEASQKPLGVRTRNNNKLYQPACSVMLGLGLGQWKTILQKRIWWWPMLHSADTWFYRLIKYTDISQIFVWFNFALF